MSAARPDIALDRAYDLRVLAAIPPTLGLFAPGQLEMQLRQMAAQRRAICFTILAPVTKREARATMATVLVCLHVAPELAAHGVASLLAVLDRAAEAEAEPIHEMAAPAAYADADHAKQFYREAIYLDGAASVSVTTHPPSYLPAETVDAVAAVMQGTAVDIVTTVAITPWRARLAAGPHAGQRASTTLH
jgi:hypothetical protein